MFELYKNRVTQRGETMNNMLKQQAKSAIDMTFTRDIAYKKVYVSQYEPIVDEENPIDAKYFVHQYVSITGDAVDYFLQFRPDVHYPIGSYVYIPDEQDIYHWWLIVNRDDQLQFPLYYVLKCNWYLTWEHDGEFYKCLGCIRDRNSYNSGVWSADTFTTPENQTQIWLPTTNISRTLTYNYSTIVCNNPIHPIAWDVTKVLDTTPFGITKVVLYQRQYNVVKDALLAQKAFENNNVEMDKQIIDEPIVPDDNITYSISCVGKPTIAMAGNYKTFRATAVKADGTECNFSEPHWEIVLPVGYENCFDVQFVSDTSVKIKCLSYYNSTNADIIQLKFTSLTGNAEFEVKVVG